jgi:hypothetical protein
MLRGLSHLIKERKEGRPVVANFMVSSNGSGIDVMLKFPAIGQDKVCYILKVLVKSAGIEMGARS